MLTQKFISTQFQIGENNWKINSQSDGLLHLVRTDQYTRPVEIIDTFGPGWLLGWESGHTVELRIRSRNRFIQLNNKQFLFIPPFSIAHWKIHPGILRWNAFISDLALPIDVPSSPAVYALNREPMPRNFLELCSFLLHKTPQFRIIEERTRSPLAPLVKNHLNLHYRESQSIQELAAVFDVSRVVLSRAFSDAYGLSPLEYRQRLRMAHTMYRVTQGHAVSTSLHEGGLSSRSEFYRQYKNLHAFTPCSLSSKK